MAHTFVAQGDLQRARALFVESIENKHMANFMPALNYTLEGLASIDVIQNQLERAVRLIAWTDAVREKTNGYRPQIEQSAVEKDLAIIHSQMDDTEFARLSAEGRSMTTEQAIALALEEN